MYLDKNLVVSSRLALAVWRVAEVPLVIAEKGRIVKKAAQRVDLRRSLSPTDEPLRHDESLRDYVFCGGNLQILGEEMVQMAFRYI